MKLASGQGWYRRTVKVKVLCYYKAWARISGSSVSWVDAIMITVTNSGEIEETFRWQMRKRLSEPNPWAIGGRTPRAFELIKYLPMNGRARFQESYFVEESEHVSRD